MCGRARNQVLQRVRRFWRRQRQQLHADDEAAGRAGAGKKTVQQAIETIRDRVDTLGVSEPPIQEYGLGENQILVELPGIDDIDQVKTIIQSTARLEIHAVVGGPYKDDRRLWPAWAACFRLTRKWCMARARSATARMPTASTCCTASRLWPATTSAPPIPAPTRTDSATCSFTLTNEAGDKFYDYTSKNVGKSMAVVMGGRVREVANIQSAIRDSRRN